MLDYLATSPLLTLVIILALGLALGKIRCFGISLGAAAVLFVALALSTLNPELELPPLLYQLGLAMFVYAIGLEAGGAFFAQFKARGWKLNLFLVVLLVAMAVLSVAIVKLLGIEPTIGAGMFAGALTSTPGMAAMVNMLGSIDPSQSAQPVVGYSLAYPGAVIGSIVVAAVGAKLLKVNHREDARAEGLISDPLAWRGVRIGEGVHGRIGDVQAITGQQVIASRIVRSDHEHELGMRDRELCPGMVLVLNGTPDALEKAIAVLGEPVELSLDGTNLVYSRITVSNKDIAGMSLGQLNTCSRGFLVVRARRGDADEVPNPSTVIRLSDRVRVVTTPERLPEVRRYLGDSERELADVDLLPFFIGLLAGLLLGIIPVPLPGGNTLSLGFGGGPIVAGLVLGAMEKSGPLRWQVPYHANRTISTLGLSIFLAGVGTKAGVGFRQAITDPSSFAVIGGGFIVTIASAVLCAAVCMPVLKLKWDEAMGVAAGMTTNPAVISYLNGQTTTELATRGYATVYPTAMIGKIIASQVVLLLLI
ncbi:aspartate:alanine exchanger family transporter [Corynebacterium pelargi]|uniref:Aspartate/alanine antiporter n=1 Tax=Corynebacterium pelargi TaxID=1471400 RepID=A0A410WAN3_9CORY|nr:aspartate:alanine exchanger family transporter [Corynebacterium pelargi]QAU53043.1 Aspartate/alanine antiporter [Corynebacterium pelargi]GGG75240.1 putative transporter Cgl0590/cg0683 [Corynebacterium pelargi]